MKALPQQLEKIGSQIACTPVCMLELNWQRAILVHLGGQLANRKDEMYRAAFAVVFSDDFPSVRRAAQVFSLHQLKSWQSERRRPKMKFTDFYSDIKSYFAAHPEEFMRFRKCDTVRKKLAYLVQNGMVRKKLILLKKSRISDKRMPEYVPSAKRDWRKRSAEVPLLNAKSKQFPQLTSKAKVTDSNNDKGRCVVATEKIMPGEVIIHERPYAIMVYPECSESHCQLCFKSLSRDKISCQRCQKVC